MKKYLFVLPLLALVLFLTAEKIIDDKMKNILQQIQLSENGAQNLIWSDCVYSSYSYPNPMNLKSIASGERTSIVETVAKYVKEYSSTPEFLSKYKEFCENQKPTPPEKPKTMDEMKEEQRKSIKEGIKNMEETKSKMPADQQGVFDESIKQYKEQLKEIDNPDNPMFSKDMENMYKQMYDQQITDYNNKVTEWQNKFPENNPKQLIKNWLTNFLDETKDVDFSAETAANQYNQEVFVKQEYERKSSLWKLCYRAGKEATNFGRAFAQKWLSEL
jgi:hypothetical protein